MEIVKQTFSSARPKPARRVSFLAGLHGDELEGVYLCFLLVQYLRRLKETEPGAFLGEVNVYPAVNPQALCHGSRLWPFFSVDMNRLMGEPAGNSLPAGACRELLADLKACSDLAVDLHSSNQHLVELPQIRIVKDFEKKLLPLALQCNVDVIWVHPMAGVFESTLGYNLNRAKVPTLVMELGICLRIHRDFCSQILDGAIHLLHHAGVLNSSRRPRGEIKTPLVLKADQVGLVQAKRAGLFAGRVKLGDRVGKGDKIGDVVDPVRGETLEEIVSPFEGTIFTLRELPLIYEGAPLARVALEGPDER
ncbi:MAG: succinylglutamate desuccinylase/aspartoacylase family protein [Nitrospinae bacterium]|nr:succinylglutamate desuccinylase/aspartoacylase family protein [Nitrospinota bacterium]